LALLSDSILKEGIKNIFWQKEKYNIFAVSFQGD
jgi:hypothetical protein